MSPNSAYESTLIVESSTDATSPSLRPEDMQGKDKKKTIFNSLKICLFCFWLYAISYTLVIPAFPSLLLQVTGGNSGKASTYYGFASSIRYTLEFFSSPFLGNLSDSLGRKKILMISLATMTLEFFLLALFPSIGTVFVVSVISGLGNAAIAMGYAIVTDIALSAEEPVTNNFGYFAAVFGLGFIIGPLCGSMLININLSLCFLVAGSTCFSSLAVTFFFLNETCTSIRPYDPVKSSPIYSLRVFFANRNLLLLSVPYMLSNLCTGIYFIWVLYMTNRFNANIMQIGIFLSVSGVCGVLVQGLLIPSLIPKHLNDERATLIGLALSSVQLLAYGFCETLVHFFIVLIVCSPALMYGPALKALLVKAAGPDEQGALQGALGSLRTATAGVGSLLFTGAFSLSVTMKTPKVAGLPFYLASFFYCISYFITKQSLAKSSSEGDDVLRNVEESLNLLDKGYKQTPKSYKQALFNGINPAEDAGSNAVNYMAGSTNCPLLPDPVIPPRADKDKMSTATEII